MQVTGAAAVFPVRDLAASLRFYIEALGFAEEFRFDTYAGICRGRMLLHLSLVGSPNTGEAGSGCAYVFCDEIDDYHARITAAGVRTDGEPQTYSYGMRDFVAFDPDGNRLTFGCPVKGGESSSGGG